MTVVTSLSRIGACAVIPAIIPLAKRFENHIKKGAPYGPASFRPVGGTGPRLIR